MGARGQFNSLLSDRCIAVRPDEHPSSAVVSVSLMRTERAWGTGL